MERDIFRYRDERNLKNIEEFIHSQQAYEFKHNIAFAIVNLIENKTVSSVILMMAYAYTYWKSLTSIVGKTNQEIEEEIKTTDYYKECMERYNEYLSSIANAFNSTDLTNSLEYSLLYTELLHLGYFSITGEYTYKIENYDKYNLLELMGVRVLEGSVVCKHASVFLGNLLDELNIQSYQQDCKAGDIGKVKLYDFFITKKANHLITAVIEDNKKIYVDPMNRSNPLIDINSKRSDLSIDRIIFPYQTKIGLYNFFADDDSFNLVNGSLDKKHLQAFPLASLEKDEIEEMKYKTLQNLIIYEEIFKETKQRQLENMKRIVELENMLVPHGDTKPKVWVLK